MLRTEHFGEMPDGRGVSRYILRNAHGVEVSIINYAAAVVSYLAPDSHGKSEDIVLGFRTLADYLRDNAFIGAVVGRYANRIAGAHFKLDGEEYRLRANDGANTLHGGPNGFFHKYWDCQKSDESSVTLSYLSSNGEEGFSGNLHADVTYQLTAENELRIDFRAVTDRPTVICLTNHSYFNLAAGRSNDILQHELQIDANQFLPIDSSSIPTGELRAVRGTPFDFTRSVRIGSTIGHSDEQVKLGHGFDHCWVLRKKQGNDLALAATLREPTSRRALEVWTTEPGIQFYSGNFLNTAASGKHGRPYTKHQGLCLETEHFPDSPNHSKFPSTVLRPGAQYCSTTIYKVGLIGELGTEPVTPQPQSS